jgi:colanic acid/amylovoran biosynthesis glycosyltransferase
MSKINLAILSPSTDAYSETFIRAHKEIPGVAAKLYSGGFLPKRLEIKGYLEPASVLRQILYRVMFRLRGHRLSYSEWVLLQSFKKEKIQVVLAEYGTTACYVLRICQIARIPLIVHFHGYDASKKEILQKYQFEYKAVFQYASAVIAVSKVMKNTLIQIGCLPEKIKLNPCGPNPLYFQLEPTFNEISFVSVGRFVDKKAPYYVVLAFNEVLKKYPNAQLVMIGEGPLLNSCKNLAHILGSEDQISFPGVLPMEVIQSHFKNALAFVQHSITADNGDMEGTPVAVLEASAAGLPVISTRHAGIPDAVIHGETGFLCAEHDVQQMAEYMMEVIENKALAKNVGQKGRALVRQEFTLEKHLKILSEAIKNTVD